MKLHLQTLGHAPCLGVGGTFLTLHDEDFHLIEHSCLLEIYWLFCLLHQSGSAAADDSERSPPHRLRLRNRHRV